MTTPARSGRIAVAGVGLLALLGVSTQLPIAENAHRLALWFSSQGPLGAGIFLAMYVAWSLLLPKTPLVILAGYVYGWQYGLALSYCGGTAAVVLGFLAARWWGRHHAEAWMENRPLVRACDRALAAHGGKVVALLRLSPLIPFNLQNYLYGLSQVPLRTCLFASWFGMLPGIAIFVGIGAVAGSAEAFSLDENGWLFALVGALSAIVAAGIIAWQARKYLGQYVAEANAQPVAVPSTAHSIR